MLCVCGVHCEGCPSFGKECAGCQAIEGKVFWAKYISSDVCPIYQCVKDKSFENCGDCAQMPCELWFSLKDPAWSDEEHQQSIKERLSELRKSRSLS